MARTKPVTPEERQQRLKDLTAALTAYPVEEPDEHSDGVLARLGQGRAATAFVDVIPIAQWTEVITASIQAEYMGLRFLPKTSRIRAGLAKDRQDLDAAYPGYKAFETYFKVHPPPPAIADAFAAVTKWFRDEQRQLVRATKAFPRQNTKASGRAYAVAMIRQAVTRAIGKPNIKATMAIASAALDLPITESEVKKAKRRRP
jgi:hypothetical protein